MKFCLLSTETCHTEDKKAYAPAQNSVNTWHNILGGELYNGPLFEKGKYGLDYDYFDRFDLVMVNLRPENIEAGIKVKQRSKAKLVVFLDREVDYFTTHTPRVLQARMVELLNTADAVAVLHVESIPFFRALTHRPVGLVGLPFPLDKVREMCPPVQKNIIIELGSSIRSAFTDNGNALVNLAALSAIGLPGIIDMLDPVEEEYLRSIREYVPLPKITLRKNSQGWDQYITRANYSLLGLHLDHGHTWGSFPLECAAVGMPCVSSPSLFTQKTLFPGLCVSHHNITGAADMVRKLVSDAGFYEEAVSYAQSQIEFFSYQQCKERLFNLIS